VTAVYEVLMAVQETSEEAEKVKAKEEVVAA
jgi:hypothetical protein